MSVWPVTLLTRQRPTTSEEDRIHVFKTIPILIFTLIPLALVLLFVVVGSMDGVDSERQTFPSNPPEGRIDVNHIELANVAPLTYVLPA